MNEDEGADLPGRGTRFAEYETFGGVNRTFSERGVSASTVKAHVGLMNNNFPSAPWNRTHLLTNPSQTTLSIPREATMKEVDGE
jgi:hypothetical protein